MHSARAVTHDSLAPDRLGDRTVVDLQLAINRALMDRIDALVARVDQLERTIKGVAAAGPIY